MPTTHTKPSRPSFFLYSRKSSEAEDRQVLSIESQIDEVKRLADNLGIHILEVLTEARSAKAPGRPVFNEMMRRVCAGEVAGILCWKLDRLARNPVDGGALIWAVKDQGIRIVTPTQTFSRDDDNTILMYIEFGMAQKYIDDLGRAVKRGYDAKAKRGWYPRIPPLGYLSNPNRPKGQKDAIKDPDRFALVRKLWDLVLTGSHTVPMALKIANEQWGLRTRAGKPLSRMGAYHLFVNPFYTGSFEYPPGSGHWIKGTHEPMITETEYDLVQKLLGRRGRPKASTRTFAYSGLIHCASCGAMVTAEEKSQLICGSCRHKFVDRHKDRCPKCGTSIQAMLDGKTPRRPTFLRYVYYHCTKRKDPSCTERAIRDDALEEHLGRYLEKLHVPERFERWVLDRLQRSQEDDSEARKVIARQQEADYQACLARLDNLVRLKTAPDNVDGRLLTDSEYAVQRTVLLKEKDRLETLSEDKGRRVDQWFGLVEEVFAFTRKAPIWLHEEDPGTKRLLLAVFAMEGSNLTLSRKKLTIDAPKPFPILQECGPILAAGKARFEPKKSGSNKAQTTGFDGGLRPLRAQRYYVRTYGETGVQFARKLKEWLETVPVSELSLLQNKLRTLFDKVGVTRRAA